MKNIDKSLLKSVGAALILGIVIRLVAGDGLFAFITGAVIAAAAVLFAFAGNFVQSRLNHSGSDRDYYTLMAVSKNMYKKGQKDEAMHALRELLHIYDGRDYYQDDAENGSTKVQVVSSD